MQKEIPLALITATGAMSCARLAHMRIVEEPMNNTASCGGALAASLGTMGGQWQAQARTH